MSAAPADTRDRILGAALQVMGEHGVAGLTNRRVAAAAGLSLGSLTYHFPSQTDLLREGLARFVAEEIARIEAIADSVVAEGGMDGAAAAVERTLAAMTFGAAELGVYEVYLQAARDPDLRGAAQECFDAYERLATTLLDRLGVPHAAATAPHVVALVLGAQIRRVSTGADDAVAAAGIAAGLVQLLAGSAAVAG